MLLAVSTSREKGESWVVAAVVRGVSLWLAAKAAGIVLLELKISVVAAGGVRAARRRRLSAEVLVFGLEIKGEE